MESWLAALPADWREQPQHLQLWLKELPENWKNNSLADLRSNSMHTKLGDIKSLDPLNPTSDKRMINKEDIVAGLSRRDKLIIEVMEEKGDF